MNRIVVPVVLLVCGIVLSGLATVLRCDAAKTQESSGLAFEILRTIPSSSMMAADFEVVRDPVSGRCFLRSWVKGGASFVLLPDCK